MVVVRGVAGPTVYGEGGWGEWKRVKTCRGLPSRGLGHHFIKRETVVPWAPLAVGLAHFCSPSQQAVAIFCVGGCAAAACLARGRVVASRSPGSLAVA